MCVGTQVCVCVCVRAHAQVGSPPALSLSGTRGGAARVWVVLCKAIPTAGIQLKEPAIVTVPCQTGRSWRMGLMSFSSCISSTDSVTGAD